jgi:Transposase DDE domain
MSRGILKPDKLISCRHAMDWTDFDADDQTTLAFSLVSNHGRATPLLWFSVFKAELAGRRNDIEDMCLVRLKQALPEGTRATILADRGFGDAKLFGFLEELGFDYVVRFRGDVFVTAVDGETRRAEDWIGANGRARKLAQAEVSNERRKVGAVVCVKAKGMKEAWHLAASDAEATARAIVNLYAKRWTIDIDQAWRLSRLCGGGGGVVGKPWRHAAPGWRRGSYRLQRRDRLGIGAHQHGSFRAAADVAAG